MISLNKNEIKMSDWHVDPFGSIFYYGDRVFRTINSGYEAKINKIFEVGLYDELFKKNLIVETSIATDLCVEGFEMILEHKMIPFVTYPHEWSFDMLRDAVLTLLDVQLICKKYDFELKDGHPLNIAFDGFDPVFIDFGSLVKTENKQISYIAHWIGLDEFLKRSFYPFILWCRGDFYLAQNILSDDYGPSRLLPVQWFTCSSFKFFKIKVILEFWIVLTFFFNKLWRFLQNKEAKILIKIFNKIRFFKKIKLEQKIYKIIKKQRRKRTKTAWSDYHNQHISSCSYVKSTDRFDYILSLINQKKDIKTAIDIAGNKGVFSRLLLEKTQVEKVFCADYDSEAVNDLYLSIKSQNPHKKKVLTPALMNIIAPRVSVFKRPLDFRIKSDLVCILAITHHLILSQGVNISYMLKTFKKLTSKYIIIEFMPLGLMGADGRAPSIPNWYTLSWFKRELEKHFFIISEKKTGRNRISIMGELK